MTDISREKILDLMWENRNTLVNADIHPKAIIAVDLYYTKLETAIKSGRMDADPWIPVSTPPEIGAYCLCARKVEGDENNADDSVWWFGCAIYREFGFPWVTFDNPNPVTHYKPITPPIEEDDNE